MNGLLLRIAMTVAPLAWPVCAKANQEGAVSEAVAALQRGDLTAAEELLRAGLNRQPDDAEALDVLAVVLDQEKKYTEADPIYARALAQSPQSPALLNNFGNHLLAENKIQEARTAFLKVLALNPGQTNACVQLARIRAQQKTSVETACLNRLPPSPQSNLDPRLSFSLGLAFSAAKQYQKAEAYFAHAVEAQPDNFEALYDLGLAASHAGHKERARDVLQKASERQPENVDVLYDLAAVETELGQKDQALELLAHASQLAPNRADVQRLLAHTAAELGDLADAAESWKRYMELAPNDDTGRREYAFLETALQENSTSALADLQWYVRNHPNDAIGHYELGTAESGSNSQHALDELNRAIVLKPDLTAAHVARGLLYYRLGRIAAALPDFEFAAQRQPENARILDRLGEMYSALNRSADALRAFRKAADLAPRDSSILLHFARALQASGQMEESKAVFARFRELGPTKPTVHRAAGLVEFSGLSPEEQFSRYRAGVERAVQKDPSNAEAQIRYLELLLNDGKIDDAATVAQKILALKPSPALLADAASVLLAAEQYQLANTFIQQARLLVPNSPNLPFDQALATFHVSGPAAALEQMDHIPPAERDGDYYLARMQMLDALGQPSEASKAFREALELKPVRPELYRQAALLLIRKGRAQDALRLLEQAARLLPNDADLSFLRAVLMQASIKPPDSDALSQFASRWPESNKIWTENR